MHKGFTYKGTEPYTMEEARGLFLSHVWGVIDYWEEHSENKRDAMEGVAFSILSSLDGSSVNLPGYLVEPNYSPEDEEFNNSQGYRYYNDSTDIGGSLHELFYKYKDPAERIFDNSLFDRVDERETKSNVIPINTATQSMNNVSTQFAFTKLGWRAAQ